MSQRNLAPGLILIGIGAVLFVVQATEIGAEAIVAVIGSAFLLTYAVTRRYAFMFPGGILTGLGLGILWETEMGSAGGAVLVGLGLGFISIAVVGALVRDPDWTWWPVIPGGILAAIGGLIEAEQQGALQRAGELWPLVLIAIGIFLIAVRLVRHDAAPDHPPRATGEPIAR